jgi:ABC-2 type transport system permease protein
MNKFLWLVRRELWEARSVWVPPAILAVILVAGTLLGALLTGSVSLQGLPPDELAKLHEKMTPEHLDGIASLALGFIFMVFLVLLMFTQFAYAIDSLYGERRDRAILFWKSLPVSDTQTVLSKLLIASVVMPLVALAIAIVTQFALFATAGAKLASIDLLTGHLWTPQLWAGSMVFMLYITLAGMLWYLPLIGWYLLVSAWAPRSPLMYAVFAPPGVALAEFLVFHTHHLGSLFAVRVKLFGLLSQALGGEAIGNVLIDDEHFEIPRSLFETMRPAQFLGSVEVWGGVVVGVLLVAAAVWVRRSRDESA